MTLMDILYWVLIGLQGLSGVLLIFLVLIHSPKGDGIGGIGSSAQIFSSQKGAEATLNKITAWAAATFFISSFVLGYYLVQKP